MSEANLHKSLENPSEIILSFDWDDTICRHPRLGTNIGVGEPLPEAFEVLRELKEIGYKMILNTCRSGMWLEEAVAFAKQNGVTFDAVNEQIRDVGSRKLFFHYHFDDRSFPPFPGWATVREVFVQKLPLRITYDITHFPL